MHTVLVNEAKDAVGTCADGLGDVEDVSALRCNQYFRQEFEHLLCSLGLILAPLECHRISLREFLMYSNHALSLPSEAAHLCENVSRSECRSPSLTNNVLPAWRVSTSSGFEEVSHTVNASQRVSPCSRVVMSAKL